MQCRSDGSRAEKAFVCVGSDVKDRRIHVRSPAWIWVAVSYSSASESEVCFNDLRHFVLTAFHRAALQSFHMDFVASNLHRSQVGGSLNEAFNLLAHVINAVRSRINGSHYALSSAVVDNSGRSIDYGADNLHILFGVLIFIADNGVEFVEFGKSGIYLLSLNADNDVSLNGDGIVLVAEVDVCHLHVALLHHAIHKSHHELVGASAFEVDVSSRVTALEVLEENVDKLVAFRSSSRSERESGVSAHTASATHADFAIFFAVEVKQDVAIYHAFAKVVGASHSHLFIHSK